jgi:FADH2 O2-dependent halogenase
VAASPDDYIADTHWLREDVDHHLAVQAGAAGVEILEEVELSGVDRSGNGWHLTGTYHGQPVHFEADLLIDASGPGGFLARHLPIPRVETEPRTTLVYGHFEGMADFAEVASGAYFPQGPYPDEQAAVHHILEEGWMYVLPFDHGTVSAGFVIAEESARTALASLSPDQAWDHLLARYPTLRDQFAPTRPARTIGKIPRLQHRLAQAAGDGWALLPHAYCFLSPLFSTGIAWSLLAVERLALLLERGPEGLHRYGDLLSLEADHIQKLVAGAYATMGDFDRFAAGSLLYFAAASFAEASQRLLPGPADGWAWSGFLGSTDPVTGEMLNRVLAGLQEPGFEEKIRQIIAPRNLAGLGDPTRNRLYPVDLEPLIEGAGLLGLTKEEIRREIPRLRGAVR